MKNIEERAVYKVQAHLNPQDFIALEKYCEKKKKPISSVVRDLIKEHLETI